MADLAKNSALYQQGEVITKVDYKDKNYKTLATVYAEHSTDLLDVVPPAGTVYRLPVGIRRQNKKTDRVLF